MTNNGEMVLKLKAAAEKATPGRIGDRTDGSGSIKYECFGYDGSLVLKTDHKNMKYGFVGDNSDADELFFRMCVPDFILALLAEHDADKKRIEMLEKYVNDRDAQNQNLLLNIGSLQQRIAELEARTVSVKLPRYDLDQSDCDSCGQDCGADMSEEPDGDYVLLADVVKQLAAAGINLEVGE